MGGGGVVPSDAWMGLFGGHLSYQSTSSSVPCQPSKLYIGDEVATSTGGGFPARYIYIHRVVGRPNDYAIRKYTLLEQRSLQIATHHSSNEQQSCRPRLLASRKTTYTPKLSDDSGPHATLRRVTSQAISRYCSTARLTVNDMQ
eukprot:scaffold173750_cov34-Prasinocladus_malaysianus.AAC.1